MKPLQNRVTDYVTMEDLLFADVGDKFAYPPIGPKHEKESFNLQSATFNKTEPPPRAVRDRALARMEDLLSKSKWEVPVDVFSREHIERNLDILMSKNKESNPGAILTREGYATNQDVMDHLGREAIISAVRKRILQYANITEKGNLETDEARHGIADPIRIFQKREQHKLKKVQQRRWRLIAGVSLIDQLVDRCLWGELVDASLKNCESQPNKPGYNFKRGGVNRMVLRYGADGSDNWVSFDRSGHDFTVAGYQNDDNFELDTRLCVSDRESPQFKNWWLVAQARHVALNYGVLCFSDGTLIAKTKPGMQNSGAFKTIDSNCKTVMFDRVYYDIAHDKPTLELGIVAMGDDTVEKDLPEDLNSFVEWMKVHRGRVVTVESERGKFHEQNFCSMDFRSTAEHVFVGVPRNFEKTVYGIYKMEKKAVQHLNDTLNNLCVEYAYHKEFNKFWTALRQRDPQKCRSPQFYQQIHNGFENGSLVKDETPRERYEAQCAVGA